MDTFISDNCGATEKETLLKTLLIVSRWAISLTRNMMVVEESLSKNFGISTHWSIHENMSREELVNALYEAKILGSGVGHYIREVYEDTDKRSLLPKVMNEFVKVKEMCEGKRPFPISGYTYDEPEKCLGKNCFKEYCVIRLSGIPDFFHYLIRTGEIRRYIRKTIEDSFVNGRKIALLFNSKDSFDVVRVNAGEELDELQKKFPGIRFLYKNEKIEEWITDMGIQKVEKSKKGKK